MLAEHIQEIIEKCPENRSPIFFGRIKYSILKNRKYHFFEAEKIVMKGTIKQIKISKQTKSRVLSFHFQGSSDARKKAYKFEKEKLVINEVYPEKFLGYGVEFSEEKGG